MNSAPFESGSPSNRLSSDRNRLCLHPFLILGCEAMTGGETVCVVAHAPVYEGTVCITESHRRRDERVEHGLEVEGRAADHLEHVSGGGLLLQRFPQLVQQARILDGDYRLIGKGRDKLDLLVGKWLDLELEKNKHPDNVVFP